jgi:hypothetical protein
MNDRELVQTIIVGTVGALRRGAEDEAVNLWTQLANASDETAKESVRELALANAQMLFSLVGSSDGSGEVLIVAGEDTDGNPISIDEVEPAQRTATRVMLAYAHGLVEDAELQLELVAHRPQELQVVFVHLLCWAVGLLDICDEEGSLIPSWLRPVLA